MTDKTDETTEGGRALLDDIRTVMFRKDALDRFTRQEDLDQLFYLTPRRAWVSLAALVLLLAAFVAWLATGL